MSFSNVSGSLYLGLLKELQEVCISSDIKMNHESLKFIENPVAVEQFDHSHIPVHDVENNMGNICSSKLAVYEAANRVGLKTIAAHFLKEWSDELNLKSFELINSHFTHEENVKSVLRNSLLKMPLFKISLATEATEKEILNSLKSFELKEIVYRKLHENESVSTIPEHAAKEVLFYNNPYINEFRFHLIQRYFDLQRDVDLSKALVQIDNQTVVNVLSRFKNLRDLNLTNCGRVTTDAFRQITHHLNSLTITNTQISEDELKKFPNFKVNVIYNEQSAAPFNLIDLYNRGPKNIPVLMARVDKATEFRFVIPNNMHSLGRRNFCDEFFLEEPTLERFKLLQNIIEKVNLTETREYAYYFNSQIYDTFLKYINSHLSKDKWDQSYQTNGDLKPESLCILVLNELIKTFSHQDVRCKQKIVKSFFEDLALTHRRTEYINANQNHEITYAYSYCPKTEIRLKTILKLLRNNSDGLYTLPLIEDIYDRVEEIKEKLFKSNSTNDLNMFKLLNEIVVELSHQALLPEPYHLTHLENPFLSTRIEPNPDDGNMLKFVLSLGASAIPNPPAQSNQLYKLSSEHTLACAMVTNLTREKRIELLENILFSFKNFIPLTSNYPLQKIICGAMTLNDYAEEDKKGLLIDRLGFEPAADRNSVFRYKGVFEENIPSELKDKFLIALCEGQLGGKTIALIDGLVALYQRSSTTASMKAKIKEAIDKFREVGYIISGSSSFNLHAQEKFKTLV